MLPRSSSAVVRHAYLASGFFQSDGHDLLLLPSASLATGLRRVFLACSAGVRMDAVMTSSFLHFPMRQKREGGSSIRDGSASSMPGNGEDVSKQQQYTMKHAEEFRDCNYEPVNQNVFLDTIRLLAKRINIGNLSCYEDVLSTEESPNKRGDIDAIKAANETFCQHAEAEKVVRNKTPRGWELKYARISFFPYWKSV